jgi:hypothetical protein
LYPIITTTATIAIPTTAIRINIVGSIGVGDGSGVVSVVALDIVVNDVSVVGAADVVAGELDVGVGELVANVVGISTVISSDT